LSAKGTYSTRYYARAYPAVHIKFVHPVYPQLSDETEALIDSGASGTLIPQSTVKKLALRAINETIMKDYQGNITGKKPVYYVTVVIDSLIFNVNAAETEGNAIIGRDIMNKLTTTLYGKQQKWEMK